MDLDWKIVACCADREDRRRENEAAADQMVMLSDAGGRRKKEEARFCQEREQNKTTRTLALGHEYHGPKTTKE
jgi:hypothetical protein